jgi:hypothetical protein
MKTKDGIRAHVKKRLQERFGVAGNHLDYIKIKYAIRSQTAKCIGRVSHRVSVWLVNESPGPMKVLYDGKRGEIVTVLPVDAVVPDLRATRNMEVEP